MDYVVHINDGSREVSPIVLRLLPGEETVFNLKVVNHGEPSNISLETSDPLEKAVRLKKPDHYVVMEEDIPIKARMPERVKRLEGEILLTSSTGSSSVPISLVSESDNPGGDVDRDPVDMERPVDEDMADDLGDKEGDVNGEDEEDEGKEYKDDELDSAVEEREEAERIRFSRQKDLQSYRAALRSRRTAGFGGSRGDERSYDQGHDQGHDQSYDQGYDQSFDQSLDQRYDRGRDQVTHASQDISQEENEHAEENSKDELRDRILTMRLNRESIQVVPAIILLSLIFALVLTFYTESIPEYPGALASSILIVTLIIYGAATLLKA